MKGQRAPTAMGLVDMATPYFSVSGQRAEIAKVMKISLRSHVTGGIRASHIG